MPSKAAIDDLKRAYQGWHDTKGQNVDAWLEMMVDTVSIRSVGDDTPELDFARSRNTKSEAIDYFAKLNRDWRMDSFIVQTVLSEGDKVAAFGRCNWVYKQTGKPADVAFAHLLTYSGDKIISILELFDSAVAVAAMTPDAAVAR